MSGKAGAIRGTVGMLMLAVFVWLAMRFVRAGELGQAFSSLLGSPSLILLMTVAYALSFVLKASAWHLFAGARQPLWRHIPPLGYSLLVNHLLPVKIGDLVRTGLVAKLERLTWDAAFHTVGVMRMMDISVLLLFGAGGLAIWGIPWEPNAGWWLVMIAVVAAAIVALGLYVAAKYGFVWASRHLSLLSRLLTRQAAAAWAITALSWILEGAVPFIVLLAIHTPIAAGQAVWVNSMTVGGQLFHVTPGGIGTYETTMSGTLAALGVNGPSALTAAVVSHAYKFLFAFAAGFFSWMAMPIRMEEGIRWLSRRRMAKEEHAD